MGCDILRYNLSKKKMIEDVENKISEGTRLEVARENLEFFGELMPPNSVLTINLADYQDRDRFSVNHICNGLKEALETPSMSSINISKSSIVLYDDDGMKGLFLANRVPDKQSRIGLPGFIPDNSRSYYGIIWGKEASPRIYSSFGNELFEKESHIMEEKDVSAVHSLSYTLSDFALKITTDPVTHKRKHELLGIRTRSIDSY